MNAAGMAVGEGISAEDNMRLRGRTLFDQERDTLHEFSEMKQTSARKLSDAVLHASDQQMSALLIMLHFQSKKEIPLTEEAFTKLSLRATHAMLDFSLQKLQDLLAGSRLARVNFLRPFCSAIPWLVAKVLWPKKKQ